MITTCSECIYSFEDKRDGVWECRKEPIKVIAYEEEGSVSGFPSTIPEHWCGAGESVVSNALKGLDGFPG